MYACEKYEYHKGESLFFFFFQGCDPNCIKEGIRQPEQEAFMGRLIIDDTTIYEIDEECLRQKELKERDMKSADVEGTKSRASDTNKGKERPAP